MKKLIEIPDKVHHILEDFKNLTGRAISSMIQEAIYKWMVHERLMIPKIVQLYYDEKSDKLFTEEEYKKIENGEWNIGKGFSKLQKKIDVPPPEVMYCDSDKCDVINFENRED